MSLSAVEQAVGQPDLKSLFESAADDGTEVLKDAPLGEKTTLRAGGAADWYAEPNTIEGLAALVRVCREHNLPVTVLGLGSNFLVLDSGVRGLTVRLCGEPFVAIQTDGERIRCGAGARMKKVAAEARRSCLAGMEFLEGIPGSIGGGLRMNAGAMRSGMVEIVECVSFMDKAGEVFEMAGIDIEFSYRSCPLLKNQIALGAVLRGRPDSAEAIAERMAAYSQKRWDSQPAARSAGCIFKNPETIPA
ncbi:MAG: FAD-binding protein, partial [Verrucomicrobiota bacterium]|nr:FAD-binding protein [Verrucomicrobiota bacterium]